MKKIGIDLDEILVDLNQSLLDYYNEKYQTHFQEKDMQSYLLSDIAGISSEEEAKIIDDYYHSKIFKNIKPITGSGSELDKLAKNNDLFLITSRPSELQPETETWVNKYFPQTFQNIVFTADKAQVCRKLGVEYMVEDNLSFAKECAHAGIKVFLVSKPWNIAEQIEGNIKRVKNLNTIVPML